MKSIDNLREYALTAASVNATTRAVLAGYVDGIEREVGELRDRDYRNGMEDGKMAAERDGWVRLPVDADGVPIHVGDVMDEGKVAKVVLTDERWEPSVYVYKLPNVQHEYFCSEVTHHHAPTVEDVLREFADEVWNRYCNGTTASDSGIRELEAEYAAKLRLAGDD